MVNAVGMSVLNGENVRVSLTGLDLPIATQMNIH